MISLTGVVGILIPSRAQSPKQEVIKQEAGLGRNRGRFQPVRGIVALALGAALAVAAPEARAVDPFEIQVYDGSINRPGVAGIELHANTIVSGRRTAAPPELPPHHQSHFTLEPAVGITPWWEVGAYLQTSLQGDGDYRFAGVKLRSKFMRPGAPSDRLRVGVNFEISGLPEAYDASRWGAEVRPIVGWTSVGGRVALAFNPILDVSLGGSDRTPDFEPALSAAYVISDLLSVGVEYYASLGPVSGWLPIAEQEHYLYEVVNVLAWKGVEINIGIGEGLTAASNDFVAKTILGFSR
jgi:hypothetical protein